MKESVKTKRLEEQNYLAEEQNYLAFMKKTYLALFLVSFNTIVRFSTWLIIPANAADLKKIHGQVDGYTYDILCAYARRVIQWILQLDPDTGKTYTL